SELAQHELFFLGAGGPDLPVVVFGTLADFDEKLTDVERRPLRMPCVRQHVTPHSIDARILLLLFEKLRAMREAERADAPHDLPPAGPTPAAKQRRRRWHGGHRRDRDDRNDRESRQHGIPATRQVRLRWVP